MYRKMMSLRASAHTGVAISRNLGIFFLKSMVSRSISGIATPGCGLVRDDTYFMGWVSNSNLLLA